MGSRWIGCVVGGVVGLLCNADASAQTFSEFPLPVSFDSPTYLAAGADGNMWVTVNNNKILRLTLGGSFTEFPIPTVNSFPQGISGGPDGNVWFVEQNGNKIGRITPEGMITEFPIPTAHSVPVNIPAGPDGNLWFTEHGATAQVGRITVNGLDCTALDCDHNGRVTVDCLLQAINRAHDSCQTTAQ